MVGLLASARRWTMFLSLAGFIVMGSLLATGILAGTFLSVFSSISPGLGAAEWLILLTGLIIIIILLTALVNLLRFSKQASHLGQKRAEADLRLALSSLNRFFRYLGLAVIILLIAYAASVISTGLSGAELLLSK